MKRTLFIFCFLPVFAMAQKAANYPHTQTDYEHTMARVMKFYNNDQGDSINAMFGKDWDWAKKTRPLWSNETTKSFWDKYGSLKSFKYIGIDTKDQNPGLAVFVTEFSKGDKKTTSLTLDDDNRLGTFRFITSSDGIDELLKKSK